jgi:hypothetical protein
VSMASFDVGDFAHTSSDNDMGIAFVRIDQDDHIILEK